MSYDMTSNNRLYYLFIPNMRHVWQLINILLFDSGNLCKPIYLNVEFAHWKMQLLLHKVVRKQIQLVCDLLCPYDNYTLNFYRISEFMIFQTHTYTYIPKYSLAL